MRALVYLLQLGAALNGEVIRMNLDGPVTMVTLNEPPAAQSK